jgi:nucleoside-diphosphate-sugar epimerase
MRILVTGANGYIGKLLTLRAVALGHSIVPLQRRTHAGYPGVMCDLGEARGLNLGDLGIDAVIHLAAALTGTPDELHRTNVLGTQHLLDAMHRARIYTLIGVSSLAVIDHVSLPAMSTVDETSAVLTVKNRVCSYASSKRLQEGLYEEFASATNSVTIIRPGLVYDASVLSSAYAGVFLGPLRLFVLHGGQVPVVSLSALVEGILQAVDRRAAGVGVYHMVDSSLPGQTEYIHELQRRGALPMRGMQIQWEYLKPVVRVMQPFSGLRVFPQVLSPHGFATRLKPFRWSNERSAHDLGWLAAASFGRAP